MRINSLHASNTSQIKEVVSKTVYQTLISSAKIVEWSFLQQKPTKVNGKNKTVKTHLTNDLPRKEPQCACGFCYGKFPMNAIGQGVILTEEFFLRNCANWITSPHNHGELYVYKGAWLNELRQIKKNFVRIFFQCPMPIFITGFCL